MAFTGHRVTYQGYKCRAVQFRRSDGFSAEGGYVEMNIKDLGGLSLNMPAILWRNQGPQEAMGALGIEAANALYANLLSSVAAGGGQPARVGGGLDLFGELVFESFFNGASVGKVVFKDIYVAFEGIDEITERLAYAKKHNEGFVKVPLSDIRQFYSDTGLIFQDVNCRLRSGNYNPITIKRGGPWELSDVGKYLFTQLPGTPPLNSRSDLFSLGGNPPGEIIGQGEPAVGLLQELLNQYGLVPKMQPDGSYAVMKKWGLSAKPGKIAKHIGDNSTWTYGTKTEKKTITPTNRPSLVCVKGKRRVQRIALDYDPIVQWTDGRFYHLNDIDALTGGRYSIQKVNLQVLNNEGKNFEDIAISAPSLSDADRWIKILRKWAYKGYAPAAAMKEIDNPFPTAPSSNPPVPTPAQLASGVNGTVSVFAQPPPPPPSQTVAAKKTIRILMDEDEDFIAFLPATDAPWYKGEIGLPNLDKLFKGKASQKNTQGDQDGIVLLPPVVKARGIGEMLFTDATEIQAYLNRVADKYGQDVSMLSQKVATAQDRVNNLTSHLVSAEVNLQVTLKRNGITSNPPPDVDEGGGTFLDQLTEGGKKLGQALGGKFPTRADFNKWQQIYSNNQSIKSMLDQAKKDLEAWKSALSDSQRALQAILNGPIRAYGQAYASYRGYMGLCNLPTAIVEQKFTFDPRSGVVIFSEPMCVGSLPLVMCDEANQVIADGGVSVTFGYELHNNDVNDWTTVYIAPTGGGNGGSATASVVGVSRPSGVKAKLERMPDLTMYLDEYGNPMNLTFCVDAAVRKAQFQVSLPDVVSGYHSIYHGFAPCVLDSGINSVMYDWNGGKSVPVTHVFQNYPGGAGPLGPAMTPTQGAAELRAKFRASMMELKDR